MKFSDLRPGDTILIGTSRYIIIGAASQRQGCVWFKFMFQHGTTGPIDTTGGTYVLTDTVPYNLVRDGEVINGKCT
jgi:hypothetical protein